ncbi:MAG TPA: zf-HC2 domain-containing protein, partial [Pseudonocardiaceae bacterium]
MGCERIREALSSQLDGEATDPVTGQDEVDAHLAGCPACRSWLDGATLVTRHARLDRRLVPPPLDDAAVAAL